MIPSLKRGSTKQRTEMQVNNSKQVASNQLGTIYFHVQRSIKFFSLQKEELVPDVYLN